MTEQDRNETNTNELNWEFENVNTFLRQIFTHLKPQTAMTEKQKREQFVKAITDLGKTRQKS